MSDQLFTWPVKRSKPRARAETLELKLRSPWILLAKVKHRPHAHLPHPVHTVKDGSTFARCNNKMPVGRRINVDGEPVVPVCPDCYQIAKNVGLL